MTLKVIGAGIGRTGTVSLKIALEQLLESPCYHMVDVFSRPEDIPIWKDAALGKIPNWQKLLDGFQGALDEPPALFWPELSKAYPEAHVLLSLRDSESWWESSTATTYRVLRSPPPSGPSLMGDWQNMVLEIMKSRFTGLINDRTACIAAYERHNQEVINNVSKDRLIVWNIGDGWEPLCKALNLPLPSRSFPHENTRQEFIQRLS